MPRRASLRSWRVVELRKAAMDSFTRPAGRLVPALLLAAGLAGCNSSSTAQLAYASAKPYSPEWCEAAKTIATENYSGPISLLPAAATGRGRRLPEG